MMNAQQRAGLERFGGARPAEMQLRIPKEYVQATRRLGVLPSRYVLCVNVARQSMQLFERRSGDGNGIRFACRKNYRISTSAFGLGQKIDSNHTPLGLHRIAEKIGGGWPIGTVFRSRKPIGFTWEGQPHGTIVHRILWLEGMEPGYNRGGDVDTFQRYIYIHGFGDESTLGEPNSHGCIHLAAEDLIPLYDFIPVGTLVWISEQGGIFSGVPRRGDGGNFGDMWQKAD